jgi:molybdate transport system substrate-binding protein
VVRWLAVPVLGASLLVGGGVASAAPDTSKPTGNIRVFAAASLTDVFTKLRTDFKAANKGTNISLNFGSSGTLATQIQSGASADLFASADLTNMDKLVTARKVKVAPTTFALNEMQIVVKPGNPKGVRTLADLKDLKTIALCGVTVPCGSYAAAVLSGAGVTIPERQITRGADVKATLAAVALGDADAGIVYVTDVLAAKPAVAGVVIPDDDNITAVYPIAPIAKSSNLKLAKAFIAYVMSPAGQKTLARYGFLAP